MLAKFKMKLSKEILSKDYRDYSREEQDKVASLVRGSLDKYLLKDGSLDAAQLEGDWFPSINAKIFISHSHADTQQALNFSGFLRKEYNITSFVDSAVWGYSNELLKQFDDKYCVKSEDQNGNKIYNYEKRNQSTANIHLLLQGALAKMIDRCECLVFINSPESIKYTKVNDVSQTASPWIYSEILMANLLQTKPLEEHRKDELLHYATAEMSYPVQLKSFVDLSVQDFIDAAKKVTIKDPSIILKQLYCDKGIIKKEEMRGKRYISE